MNCECFITKNFHDATLTLIQRANEIIAEYEAQGFALTLRQLYYQFVARRLLENRQSEYKRLGSIINDARLAGLIDWDSIEDRTRELRSHAHWDDPSEIVAACASQYREDLWASQEHRPEVWIEKDALVGIIGLADIDAVIAISGVADDPLVFFVKAVHGRPREGDPCLQHTGIGEQLRVLGGGAAA